MMNIITALKSATATWVLAALNAVLFIVSLSGADSSMLSLSASPSIDLSQPWRMVSYMFLQAYPLHALFNMSALIMAGAWYESRHRGYSIVLVYITAGLAGAMAFIATGAIAGSESSLSGCSASVMGIAACALSDRRHPMRYRYTILTAALVIASTGIAGPNPGGSLAHVAGILAGTAIGLSLKPDTGATTKCPKDPIVTKAEQSGFMSLNASERATLFSKKTQ